MKNNEIDQYDRIQNFIHGQMDKSETATFKQDLDRDPELVEIYRIIKDIHELYADKDHLEFLDILSEIRKDRDKKEAAKSSPAKVWIIANRNIIMSAAAVIMLALTVYMVVNFLEKPTHRSLFKNNFAHYGHTIQPRDAGDSTDNFYNGMQLYKVGSYQDALSSLYDAKEKYKQVSAFYIGLCYLELDKYNKAAIHLKKAALINGEQKEEAEWYLALAYLAEGGIEQTENTLKQIANNPGHYYLKQAQGLLADLKKLH